MPVPDWVKDEDGVPLLMYDKVTVWNYSRKLEGQILINYNSAHTNPYVDILARDWKHCRKEKVKRKLLGYGLFCSGLWDKENWSFERNSLRDTKEEVKEVRTSHCLHHETRRIYNVTRLNVGHHSHPIWVNAGGYFERA